MSVVECRSCGAPVESAKAKAGAFVHCAKCLAHETSRKQTLQIKAPNAAEIEAELAKAAGAATPKRSDVETEQQEKAAGGSVRLGGVRLRKVAAKGRSTHGPVTEENVSRPRHPDEDDDDAAVSGEWERPSTPSSGVEEASPPTPEPPAEAALGGDELELPLRNSLSPSRTAAPEGARPVIAGAASAAAPLVLDIEEAPREVPATKAKPAGASATPSEVKLELAVTAPSTPKRASDPAISTPARASDPAMATPARPSDPAMIGAPRASDPAIAGSDSARAIAVGNAASRRSSPSLTEETPVTERTARTRLQDASGGRRSRAALLVVGGVVLLAVAAMAMRTAMSRSALVESEAAAAPFKGAGFSEAERSPWSGADALTTSVPAGACAVALAGASGKATSIVLTRGSRTIESAGPIGFCTCGEETVSLRAGAGGKSVRLLVTEAIPFGSTFGFATGPARTALVDTCGSEGGSRCACLPEQVDAWLASHAEGSAPEVSVPAPAFVPADLRGAGFDSAKLSAAGAPLVPVRVGNGECAVVAADPGDSLGLWLTGGASGLATAPGLLALCSKDARSFGVRHTGRGTVAVLRADAAKVGGRLGLSALATSARVPLRSWVEASDVTWDAENALLAALTTGKVERFEGGNRLAPEARLLAFSFEPGASTFAPPPGVHCAGTSGELLLCAQLETHSFGQVRAALGAGPQPVWLKPATQSKDPAASAAVAGAIRFAARLRAQGYELTILEGVKELATGADVLGRAGDDAVVALTVQSTPPFVVPLVADGGAPWTLEEPARPIPITPGTHLVLKGVVPPSSDLEARRTAVFRRAGKP